MCAYLCILIFHFFFKNTIGLRTKPISYLVAMSEGRSERIYTIWKYVQTTLAAEMITTILLNNLLLNLMFTEDISNTASLQWRLNLVYPYINEYQCMKHDAKQ